MHRIATFAIGIITFVSVMTVWRVMADDQAANRIENRAWVERMPRNGKDVVTWFVPMKLRGKQFGVAQRTSHFWFTGERFSWTQQGEHVRLTFQQSDRRVSLTARAYACKVGSFELCLDLVHNGNKTTLYSKKRWTLPRTDVTELPAIRFEPVGATCSACTDMLPSPMSQLFVP
ncbi:MAG: hypothetical protein KTR31_40950 [Myxococcales bacterium]|nr:hypothetical protein [Myxococcales bacterium]